MTTLLYLTVLFYAVILLGVLFCIFKGVAMCFEADTVFGVIAAVLCSTVIFASVFCVLYLIQLFWKRNLAEELMDYLNRPKPVDDGI